MSKHDKQDKFVQRSLSQQAWIQFRNNRLAICGLVVIALLVLVSITTMLIDLADGGELYKALVTKNNLPLKLAKPSAARKRSAVPTPMGNALFTFCRYLYDSGRHPCRWCVWFYCGILRRKNR